MTIKFQRNNYVFYYENIRPERIQKLKKRPGRLPKVVGSSDFIKTGSVLGDYRELRLR